jgi:hypothetical protein
VVLRLTIDSMMALVMEIPLATEIPLVMVIPLGEGIS